MDHRDREAAAALEPGTMDVLSPRGHAEWLLAHVPGAERRELPTGGHLLGDQDLDSLYAWLTAADG